MPYVLTRGEAETQLDMIRGRANQLLAGLDASQFNWQPDGGRRWSIGQCLEHLAIVSTVYGESIDAAIAAAPKVREQSSITPGLAGQWMIWTMEPPVLVRIPTRRALKPPSNLDPVAVRARFSESLRFASELAARAMCIDARRTRFANPILGGNRMFDVAAGILIILAHNRRHLAQAEKVRQSRNFPPPQS
jgi:hypothetical protein